MMITIIVLGSLAIVILILTLLLLNSINIKMDYITDSSDDETEEPQIHENPIFKAGLNHGFSIVQIALYKMYKDMNILDFDSLHEDIQRTILEISKTTDEFVKWQNEYINYLNSKGKEPN